jgi:hypothetical protein
MSELLQRVFITMLYQLLWPTISRAGLFTKRICIKRIESGRKTRFFNSLKNFITFTFTHMCMHCLGYLPLTPSCQAEPVPPSCIWICFLFFFNLCSLYNFLILIMTVNDWLFLSVRQYSKDSTFLIFKTQMMRNIIVPTLEMKKWYRDRLVQLKDKKATHQKKRERSKENKKKNEEKYYFIK